MNRILIVEDEVPIAQLIEMSLARAGYQCEAVNDGCAAADKIEQNNYDLVLLDIMLPGLDGYELLEYLRPMGTPVIFITAKGTLGDRVRGLNLGADDYIVKPFEVAELDATDELVRKITGKYPIYARAPYGEVPENGDVDRQRFYIGWTVDPLDWMTEDVSRITQSVLEKVEPGDIILLHDSYLSSVQAALRIVDALQGKGYEFITVDQMISD